MSPRWAAPSSTAARRASSTRASTDAGATCSPRRTAPTTRPGRWRTSGLSARTGWPRAKSGRWRRPDRAPAAGSLAKAPLLHCQGGAANPRPQVSGGMVMAIDVATVRKVARLARIAEPEDKLEPLARELSGIMSWIEQLNEVDTDGVEPMTTSVAMTLPMRDDVVTDGGDPAKVLSNAPKTAKGFFIVPKVVE